MLKAWVTLHWPNLMATSLTLWTSQDWPMLLTPLKFSFSLGWRFFFSPQTSLILLLLPKCANPLKVWAPLPYHVRNTSTHPCNSYQYYTEDSQSHISNLFSFRASILHLGWLPGGGGGLNWVWRLVGLKEVELGKEHWGGKMTTGRVQRCRTRNVWMQKSPGNSCSF